MARTVLISGATGQDSAQLADLRPDKCCMVHGIKQRAGLIGDLTAATNRFCQGSTSEMFGKVQEVPQRETSPLRHEHRLRGNRVEQVDKGARIDPPSYTEGSIAHVGLDS